MTRYALFGRGFLMPCLVTANSVAAVQAALPWAIVPVLLLGFLISWVWWGTVRASTGTLEPAAKFSYALGAGLGCVVGMVAGRCLA